MILSKILKFNKTMSIPQRACLKLEPQPNASPTWLSFRSPHCHQTRPYHPLNQTENEIMPFSTRMLLGSLILPKTRNLNTKNIHLKPNQKIKPHPIAHLQVTLQGKIPHYHQVGPDIFPDTNSNQSSNCDPHYDPTLGLSAQWIGET